MLESEESHSEWIIDKKHAGTAGDPKQMPFIGYGFAACRLMDAVNECVRGNLELDACSYRDVLESHGITQWEQGVRARRVLLRRPVHAFAHRERHPHGQVQRGPAARVPGQREDA